MSVLTLASGRHAAPTAPPTAPGHRPALDGVRALAVSAVVIYHLGAPWLPGGFLGVDAFFVLSGFLITSLLLDQAATSGRIALGEFFARRARRLLPALYVLILAVCAWAAFLATPAQIGDLRGAALAALLYVANWFFILTGQSYFDQSAGPSPLEHTWSLAIEEQFYLVWPLVVLLLVRRLSPRTAAVMLGAGTFASVALMAFSAREGDPTVAYFGTLTRAHELLVGAILAIAVYRGLQIPTRWRWTGWVALVALGAACATMSDTAPFYYLGGSLLVCLCVAWLLLVLAAGSPGGGPTAALSWRPLVLLGLISYGVYLWHWPLILWLTPALTGLSGVGLAALIIAATLSAATASYVLVERPIRSGQVFGLSLTSRRLAVIVPLAMALMATLIVAATARGSSDRGSVEVPQALSGAGVDGAPTVAVLGDSVPQELMPYLSDEAARRGWNVVPLAFGGCSVTGTFQVDWDGRPLAFSRRCADDVPRVQRQSLLRYEPDVVLWYSNRERYPVRVGDTVADAGSAEHAAILREELERTYRRLSASGARIVIVLPVPKAPAAQGPCVIEPGTPDCAEDASHADSVASLADAYRELANRHPDSVTVIEVGDLLCPGGAPCPALDVDGTPMRPDGVHLSESAARWYVPLLLDRAALLA